MDKFKIKLLEKKMGFNDLVELCERKGWVIPTSYVVSLSQPDFDGDVWVDEEVPIETNPPDGYPPHEDSHAYMFDITKEQQILVNKNRLEKCMVLQPLKD